MVVIGGATLFLRTYDPATLTLISQVTVLATARSVALHSSKRFFWASNITNATLSIADASFSPPMLIESVALAGNPEGIWGDDRYIYKISSVGVVQKIDPATTTVVDSFTLTGTYRGLTGDSRYLWTINTTSGNVEQVDPVTGTVVGTFTAPTNARDLHHDGRYIWFITGINSTTGTLKQYDPVTATEIGSINTRAYGIVGLAYSVTGDGRFLYVLDAN